MVNRNFSYNNLSQYGNYIFYYDSLTGKLNYKFKYNSTPAFGAYTFIYNPLDDIVIEEQVLAKKGTHMQTTDSVLKTYKFNIQIATQYINMVDKIAENIEFENISGVNIDNQLLNNSLYVESNNYKNVVRDFANSIIEDVFNDISLRKMRNKNIGLDGLSYGIKKYISDMSKLNIDKGIVRNMDFNRINSKNAILKDVINRIDSYDCLDIHIDDVDCGASSSNKDIAHQDMTVVTNRSIYDLSQEKDIYLDILDRQVNKQDFDVLKRGLSNINIISSKLLDTKNRIIVKNKLFDYERDVSNISLEQSQKVKRVNSINGDIDNDELNTTRYNNKKSIESYNVKNDILLIKDVDYKEIYDAKDFKNTISIKDGKSSFIEDSKEKSSIKDHKNTTLNNEGLKAHKKGKYVADELSILNSNKDDKGSMVKHDKRTTKFNENMNLESHKRVYKIHKIINSQNTSLIDKQEYNLKEELLSLIDKQEYNLKEELEEHLDLYKRFWFLKNIGNMDIKILPNIDFKYPAKIEIFEDMVEFPKYKYSYSDNFANLDSPYKIRLYKNVSDGIELLEEVEIDLSTETSFNSRDISLNVEIDNINSNGFNYSAKFQILINTESDIDYVIIEQPKGFMGNEFVFVSTERFLAENHPIPIGEDLGIIEFPISISIMVDFINILLLIWSKFYIAYSGRTGIQSIQAMIDRVYEWLTLETSLEEESIEAYNRCFRWFRWECEKVYNKAKLDPNLHGNRWIEEVIFEMIDYMEIHHFDNMPKWENIEKMDEQRNNLFQDVHLDMEVVIDKFKGIRKRVTNKNKRYRDF